MLLVPSREKGAGSQFCLFFVLWICSTLTLLGSEKEIQAAMAKPVIDAQQATLELKIYAAARVRPMPYWDSVDQWERYAERVRKGMWEEVIFRGSAAAWREYKGRVEWLETIPGGPGYVIRKVRYEALPGLWIPGLLYEPLELTGKVPVVLNVNGHEPLGKALPHKQLRCINLAKRGMIALNVEWFGLGQFGVPNFDHFRMNQLDLCGTPGLAVHYLYLERAIDLLLSLKHADPQRLAVTGLSGGGFQTILISSLDKRVSLAVPVAGYSSYITKTQFDEDLGDPEQIATDQVLWADYTDLTALMAPRPTLLTYNAKDDCCVKADHALGPLLSAARPIFNLYGRGENLRYHLNYNPGHHNYEQENREAFYRILRDFFYPQSDYQSREIPSTDEVKTPEALYVDLPAGNLDFHTLALNLAQGLPHTSALPVDRLSALAWQTTGRERLREVVRSQRYDVSAEAVGSEQNRDLNVTYWRFTMNGEWTIPAVEITRGQPRHTSILVADQGRKAAVKEAILLLEQGHRVVAVDPFDMGESKIQSRFPFNLLPAALGDRPLGIQASQLAAVARWLCHKRGFQPVEIVASGPRSSVFSLVAGGLEPEAVGGLELHNCLGSLKEVIEQNLTSRETPELFCFGLLQQFDIRQLIALVAPRPVLLLSPSPRAEKELKDLDRYYRLFNARFRLFGGRTGLHQDRRGESGSRQAAVSPAVGSDVGSGGRVEVGTRGTVPWCQAKTRNPL